MDGEVVIGTRLDTKSFESQIAKLEDDLDRLEQERETIASQKTISESDLELLKKYDAQIEKTTNQIVGLQKKQLDLSSQNGFGGINLQLDGILRKVTKWGMALFGIRSMYTAIRSAMSMLSQEDDNLSAQIDYIKWTLASAIAPVVKFIINAVYLILQYVNKIFRALFGFDLFKGPKEFASSMKKASGSAEKIKKSLAGFDEMNILGDNTASAGGGGGGGVDMPTFDTASVGEAVEKVKKKIKELKDTYVKSTNDMSKALTDPKAFKLAYGNWDWLMMGIVEIMASINKIVIGFGQIFGGVFDLIKGIAHLNLQEILKAFIKMGEGVANIFRGLWGIIDGIFMTLAGAVKGVILSIVDFFSKKWKAISDIASNAWKSITSIFSKKNGKSMGANFSDAFSNAFKGAINWVIDKLNWFVKQMNKIDIKLPGGESLFKVNIKPIPKLAKGTILNNPGRGVPVGNAIAGEAGREAFLPLSDTQLLEELGSTIGRYITINLTNETKLDGRTIARKVNQLSNNDNFLRNR